jgi:hypothetical protein
MKRLASMVFLVTALTALIASCAKESPSLSADPTASAPSPAPLPAKAPATMGEWKAALLSTYEEAYVEDKGDGITEFIAKFQKDGKLLLMFSKRDAFKKMRVYTCFDSSSLDSTIGGYIKSYVGVLDGNRASFVMQPTYFGKDGWLFMNKVAIMVDGEVVLEKEIPSSEVERDAESWGVNEVYTFLTDQEDIAALRKVSEKSAVSIRLTGTKGYVSANKDVVAKFKRDMACGLYVYDAINNALASHIPPATP